MSMVILGYTATTLLLAWLVGWRRTRRLVSIKFTPEGIPKSTYKMVWEWRGCDVIEG